MNDESLVSQILGLTLETIDFFNENSFWFFDWHISIDDDLQKLADDLNNYLNETKNQRFLSLNHAQTIVDGLLNKYYNRDESFFGQKIYEQSLDDPDTDKALRLAEVNLRKIKPLIEQAKAYLRPNIDTIVLNTENKEEKGILDSLSDLFTTGRSLNMLIPVALFALFLYSQKK